MQSLSSHVQRDQEELVLLLWTGTSVNAGDGKTGIVLFQQVAHVSTTITLNAQFSVAFVAKYYS